MNKNKELLPHFILATIVMVCLAGLFGFRALQGIKNGLPYGNPSVSSYLPLPMQAPVKQAGPDLIFVEGLVAGQTVSASPLVVYGRARGTWFFEASFPIRIYDADGLELGVAVAQAQDEWMTEDFVPFMAELNFKKPTTSTGTLVLQKDNPSGLAENDAELRIPISFGLNDWSDGWQTSGRCIVGGCSGQLCIDESMGDIVTTCEFRPEYACYQNAKCERQYSGQCDWTPTEQLTSCLRSVIEPQ